MYRINGVIYLSSFMYLKVLEVFLLGHARLQCNAPSQISEH